MIPCFGKAIAASSQLFIKLVFVLPVASVSFQSDRWKEQRNAEEMIALESLVPFGVGDMSLLMLSMEILITAT